MSVRHALLALLSDGPKYGLQLRQEFEARTGEVWPLNVGQVYTTLQRLERDGLVSALAEADAGPADSGPQKGYEITDGGRRELVDWLQTPPDASQPPRDELLIKVLVAVGVAGVVLSVTGVLSLPLAAGYAALGSATVVAVAGLSRTGPGPSAT